MNDTCLMCHEPWDQGDFAVVIGHVEKSAGPASLVFVHRDCLLVEVLGKDMAKSVIAHTKGNDV